MGLKAYLERDPECRDLVAGAIHAAAPLLSDPDPAPTLALLDAWAFQLAGRMPLPWNLHKAIDALNHFLFRDIGLTGDRDTYDAPANAALPLVIERRKGLPISLSILWMGAAERLGLRAVGIALPGHFIAGLQLDTGLLCFDPFHGGRPVGETEAARLVFEATGGRLAFEPAFLTPARHRDILVRLVRNLLVRFMRTGAWDDALWAANHLVLLSPEDSGAYRDRAEIHLQRDLLPEAIADLRRALALSAHPDPELEASLSRLLRAKDDHGPAPLP